jgi:hypothetical protein
VLIEKGLNELLTKHPYLISRSGLSRRFGPSS